MFEAGFQRLQDALCGIPDRVPFIAQMHEFAMTWSGEPSQKFYTGPETLVDGIINAAEDFGFDIPCLGYDVYNIEAEALGVPVIYGDNSPPCLVNDRPLISSREDLEDLRPPDPLSSGRMPFVLEANRLFEKKTGHPPPIQFTAPFSLAVILRGYENLVQDLAFHPDFAHHLLGWITETLLAPWIRALRKASPGASAFRGADAMASLPLVDFHILQEYVVPYIERLKGLCGEEITVLNWWGERYLKDPEKLLDLKLRISPSLIQGQDPDVETIGPEVYKKFARKHGIPLILGVGNLFLETSKKEAIRSRVAEYIRVGSPEGRFIIYLCNLSSALPAENLREAIASVKEYGDYGRGGLFAGGPKNQECQVDGKKT
jgi:uroporphyrinogen-III decarboxylase